MGLAGWKKLESGPPGKKLESSLPRGLEGFKKQKISNVNFKLSVLLQSKFLLFPLLGSLLNSNALL